MIHVVQPGDYLSTIAERHCGSVDAAESIFERNAGRLQPNGQSFTNRQLVIPGQELEIDCGETDPAQSLVRLVETNQTAAAGLVAIALLVLAAVRVSVGNTRPGSRNAGTGAPARVGRTPTPQPARRQTPPFPNIYSPSHPNARNQPGNPMYQSWMQTQMRNPMSPMHPNARNQPGNPMYRRR